VPGASSVPDYVNSPGRCSRVWVERLFAELTTKKLRRATHTSVRQLEADVRAWIHTWNDSPRPYIWTKTADQILTTIANYCTRINDSRH
jgi:hypothetical protein